jgi:type VI secretion system protein ImpH
MADDARQSPLDIDNRDALSEGFDFFELLRRLERRGRLFGRAGRADREPARLGQHVRLGFALQTGTARHGLLWPTLVCWDRKDRCPCT